MKKLAIYFVVVLLFATIFYQQIKIKKLNSIISVKIDQMINDLNSFSVVFSNNEVVTQPASIQVVKMFGDLSEPVSYEEEKVIDRIDMLRMHLNSNPTSDWVEKVLSAAKDEILKLEDQKHHKAMNKQKSRNYYSDYCPYYHPIAR